MVNSNLEKARVATDAANERAAKGAALIQYMTDGATGTMIYAYDAETGSVGDGVTTGSPSAPSNGAYGQCSKHKGGYVVVTIKVDDATDETTVEVKWAGVKSGNEDPDGITATKADS